MAKPSGSACNLDCSYCFYLEKSKLYPERGTQWRMSMETLECYIREYIEANDAMDVEFAWQGGEPTLLGLDFFRQAMRLQDKYRGRHRIHNVIQTNGLLLNDAWCEFFKAHQFLVGISLDGPAHLHDQYRVNRAGTPTHDKVWNAIKLLNRHAVDFNILTVVNAQNAQYPLEVYQHLKATGAQHIQFIPLVERCDGETQLSFNDIDEGSKVTDWSVSAENLGRFLCQVFDEWAQKDVGLVFVNLIEIVFSAWCHQPASSCVFAQKCGHMLAMESNGDLYQCDHFVYQDYKLGNINSHSLRQINQSAEVKEFGDRKLTTLTAQCRECDYRFICHGGCLKHRFIRSSSGEMGHNYFCHGYEMFFKYTEPTMKAMRSRLINGQSPSEIMS